MSTTPARKLKTKQSLNREQRVARARGAALARWGDPTQRELRHQRNCLLRQFLQSIAASYIQEFSSSPEILGDLIAPLTRWSDSLGDQLPKMEKNNDGQSA